MARLVRGILLLALLALGQARPVVAVACAPHPGSEGGGAAAHAEHETGGQDAAPAEEPDEQPSCTLMLSCGAAAALPPAAMLLPIPTVSRPALLPIPVVPRSRADAPAYPPPRA